MSELRETLREIFGRLDLRERPTQIGVISIAVIVALIAAVAAFPGSSTTDTADLADSARAPTQVAADEVVGDDAVADPSDPAGQARTQATAADPDLPDPTRAFGANPEADIDYARSIGADIEPVTTSLPGGNPNTWAGVTAEEIKAVFSSDESNCGVNVINAISQAGANFSQGTRYYRPAPTNQSVANRESREAIETLVSVFNKRGLETAREFFPRVYEAMIEHGSTEEQPFYGRKFVHEYVDGGSFQCPERTNAAAVEIAQERKPFVVFNNFDGAQYNMADALHAKAPAESRPMHFGTLWLSDRDYSRWSPYNWTQFNSGTQAADLYASWICSTKVGQNASNSPQMESQERSWGLLYPNLREARTVAEDLKERVEQYCGENIYDAEFAYAPDVSRAGDEATTIALRLRASGITTLTYLMDPIFPLFQINAFIAQDYYPEIAWTPTGYYDSNVVQRLYDQNFMNERSFGITQFGVPGGFGISAGDPFWAWHDEHQVSPNTGQPCDPSSDEGMDHDPEYCKAPGSIVTWYYTTLPLLGGILFAGPDLKPQHVTEGLWNYPNVRYGTAGPTDEPHPALLGSGEGKHYFIVDATEYRWRSWYQAPPVDNQLGFIEYTDCQRHYLRWPDQLSRGWERGSPHHDAWCGHERYAPEDTDACSDAPQGRCERDNFPRWQDWALD